MQRYPFSHHLHDVWAPCVPTTQGEQLDSFDSFHSVFGQFLLSRTCKLRTLDVRLPALGDIELSSCALRSSSPCTQRSALDQSGWLIFRHSDAAALQTRCRGHVARGTRLGAHHLKATDSGCCTFCHRLLCQHHCDLDLFHDDRLHHSTAAVRCSDSVLEQLAVHAVSHERHLGSGCPHIAQWHALSFPAKKVHTFSFKLSLRCHALHADTTREGLFKGPLGHTCTARCPPCPPVNAVTSSPSDSSCLDGPQLFWDTPVAGCPTAACPT